MAKYSYSVIGFPKQSFGLTASCFCYWKKLSKVKGCYNDSGVYTLTSGVTNGRGRGQLRCGSLFRNGSPLIRLPLFPKQFYKLKTFNLYKFVFCYCSSVCFAQGFF